LTDIAALKERVWQANLNLVDAGLVVLTWGNASAINRDLGIMAIKPSGVDYESLTPHDIVLVSLETGEPLPGQAMRPSSDTATHLQLYRAFSSVCGVVHTHSSCATSWAQACRSIPAYGTTHADTFYGEVPVCRSLTREEIEEGYEINTGNIIVEHFAKNIINPDYIPAVLAAHHGPFTWGKTVAKAVEHAIILEEIARMAIQTEALKNKVSSIPDEYLDKHFMRKHGEDAYYGQKE